MSEPTAVRMRKGDRIRLKKDAADYGLNIGCLSGTVERNPLRKETVSIRFDDGAVRRIHKDFVEVTPPNDALQRKIKLLIANYQWDGRDAEQQQEQIATEIIRIFEMEALRGKV